LSANPQSAIPTFTDIAAQAGLTRPIIYGGVDSKQFIIETNGCGVAFYDYDNDGWMDIFALSGSRLEGAPKDATNTFRIRREDKGGSGED
jgi:enediyne biosynthesis protein E4